ncbi:MAG: glycine cleavage system protein GcvH [Candidatus Bathyarchaeia archaeon]|nr:glycine cleavage system protein GcvH [Candidatus Bathyarchaeota archaeon]
MVKVEGYEVREGLYYSKEWAWVKVEGNRARIGITDYAQKQLREIVFVELPGAGTEIRKGEPYGTIESVKAVSDLVAPLTGKVVEVNEKVTEDPGTVNRDPYGDGWLIIIEPTNLSKELGELMTFEQAVEWYKEQAKK